MTLSSTNIPILTKMLWRTVVPSLSAPWTSSCIVWSSRKSSNKTRSHTDPDHFLQSYFRISRVIFDTIVESVFAFDALSILKPDCVDENVLNSFQKCMGATQMIADCHFPVFFDEYICLRESTALMYSHWLASKAVRSPRCILFTIKGWWA